MLHLNCTRSATIFGLLLTAYAVARGQNLEGCPPSGVVRSDYLLDIISVLPHFYGLPAQLDVHRVSPVYPKGCHPGSPRRAAIFVHGSSIEAVTGFDLPYRDY